MSLLATFILAASISEVEARPLTSLEEPSAADTGPSGSPATSSLWNPQPPPAPAPPIVLAARSSETPHDPDEACMDCHLEQAEGFQETGMGRSLYPVSGAEVIENFEANASTVIQPHSRAVYRAFRDAGGRWWQSETSADGGSVRYVEAKYVVGSGNHTRSYIGEAEGGLVELPLTWYVERSRWDMSPGYQRQKHFRFDRPIRAACLFCHNDLSAMERARDDYPTEPLPHGIGCRRCHGDGAAHVEARYTGQGPPAGEPDPSILNPARLTPARQLQLCQQCHLSGVTRALLPGKRWEDYDPRTPLEEHMGIFVHAGAAGSDFGIASHARRLSLSACAQKEPLRCTQCHNPHQREDTRSHRSACLSCHQSENCGDSHGQAPDASCAGCHMHRGGTSDIPHVSFTDHWIRRRPATTGSVKVQGRPLVNALPHEENAEQRSLLALAYAYHVRLNGESSLTAEAVRRLERAIREHPRWTELWLELARLNLSLGRVERAIGAFAELNHINPEHREGRLEYARLLDQIGQSGVAEQLYRAQIVAIPSDRRALGDLANSLQRQGRYREAEPLYQRADELAPHVAITAFNRGYNAIHGGDLSLAERWIREGLRRDSVSGDGFFHLGILALKRGDPPEQLRMHFSKAIQRDPQNGTALWFRGRAALRLGVLDEAESDLLAFQRLDPKNPNAYLDLARLERERGRQREARAWLERGLWQTGEHPAIREALAQMTPTLPLSPPFAP
ncbi:MAG: tetratricopeptide repeat protein [Myxococcota bacterium]|nr:tetratricopeptide repeat protein [Myxococcota bacterium]